MALIGNRSVLHKSPGRFLSGTVASIERSNFSKAGMLAGRFETFDKLSGAIPGGHLSPSAWALPRTAGGASTVNMLNGAGSMAGGGALGVNGDAALSGAGGITSALLALVVSAVASLTGSGGLTASVVGKLEAAAALAGAGSLAGAAGALASLLADLSGAGSAAGTPRADGYASANIKGYGDLTPEGLRDAVWAAIATSNNSPGTMGAVLNAAGSGGVDLNALAAAVWAYATRTLTGSSMPAEQQAQILEVWQRLGLDPAAPMTTAPTAITFGAETIDISEAAGAVTLTRQP